MRGRVEGVARKGSGACMAKETKAAKGAKKPAVKVLDDAGMARLVAVLCASRGVDAGLCERVGKLRFGAMLEGQELQRAFIAHRTLTDDAASLLLADVGAGLARFARRMRAVSAVGGCLHALGVRADSATVLAARAAGWRSMRAGAWACVRAVERRARRRVELDEPSPALEDLRRIVEGLEDPETRGVEPWDGSSDFDEVFAALVKHAGWSLVNPRNAKVYLGRVWRAVVW